MIEGVWDAQVRKSSMKNNIATCSWWYRWLGQEKRKFQRLNRFEEDESGDWSSVNHCILTSG